MIPIDQLAAVAIQFLQTHYWLATIPIADAAFKEAGKSIYAFLASSLTTKAAAGALEDANANPAEPLNLNALQTQIALAAKKDPAFAEQLRALLPAAAETTIMTATQTGNQNISTQIKGDSNRILFKNP